MTFLYISWIVCAVANMFLYDLVAPKPKVLKHILFRYLMYFVGGIPLLSYVLTFVYVMLIIINVMDDNDKRKWYNKPL